MPQHASMHLKLRNRSGKLRQQLRRTEQLGVVHIPDSIMRRTLAVSFGTAFFICVSACNQTVRRSGQVELLEVTSVAGAAGTVTRPNYKFNAPEITIEQMRVGPNARVDPLLGDLVRHTSDSVTIVVPTVHLHHLPVTLSSVTSGRYDAMLFAEIWENGATDRSADRLNRIVYVALDQRIPGTLNFSNAIAYGPTTFKGHPLRMKFTLVLLQRRAKESSDTAAKTVQDIASVAAPANPGVAIASTVVGLIRQLVKSMPDVEAFDFEATFLPFRPPEAASAAGPSWKSIAKRVEAIKSSGDLAKANAVGAELESLVEKTVRSRYSELERAAAAAVVAPDADRRSMALQRIRDSLKLPGIDGEAESIRQMVSEIERTPARVAPSYEVSAKALQTRIESAVDMAVAKDKDEQFLWVQQGAKELKEAKTSAQVADAVEKVRSCADYSKIADITPDTRLLLEDANSRPWLRYGMYALIETARFGAGQAEPVAFDPSGKVWKDNRLCDDAGPSPTNYLILDVIPGLVVQDDRVQLAASRAADDLFTAVGYTPTRDLLDNPTKVTETFEANRLMMLETVLRIKGEQLALELARNAEGSKSEVFVTPSGGLSSFAQAWDKRIKPRIPPGDAGGTKDQRWDDLRDSINNRFLARFSGS